MTTDRIERKVLLNAPVERVWRAIGDTKEFGAWFGVALDGAFVQGTRLKGTIVTTTADPEVALLQKPYEGTAFEIYVQRVEPERTLAFHWHPYAVEPGVDYAKEPSTLVTFDLQEAAEGTQLTISETGFDRLPLARRAEAYKANEGGWKIQTQLIAKHLAAHP